MPSEGEFDSIARSLRHTKWRIGYEIRQADFVSQSGIGMIAPPLLVHSRFLSGMALGVDSGETATGFVLGLAGRAPLERGPPVWLEAGEVVWAQATSEKPDTCVRRSPL